MNWRASWNFVRPTDVLVLGTLFFFSVLTVVGHSRIPGWPLLLGKNSGVALLYLLCARISRTRISPWPRFLIRLVSVSLVYGYLFLAVDKLQLLVHGRWLDSCVVRLEEMIFGTNPTLWLERITLPALTEWMMFAYLFYFAMYPVVCIAIFRNRGEGATEEYFFALGLTNILCDLGFILFPVAGPITALKGQYQVALSGFWMSQAGEFVRNQLQFVGGNIPSPHCAAATVMWVMAFRYSRRLFYWLTPLVLSLYLSTFYARYHYVTDAIAGILVAGGAILLAKPVENWLERKMRDPAALAPQPGTSDFSKIS